MFEYRAAHQRRNGRLTGLRIPTERHEDRTRDGAREGAERLVPGGSAFVLFDRRQGAENLAPGALVDVALHRGGEREVRAQRRLVSFGERPLIVEQRALVDIGKRGGVFLA